MMANMTSRRLSEIREVFNLFDVQCLISGTGHHSHIVGPKNTIQPGETFLSPIRLDGRIKIALVFPNTYKAGMSNLGYQILYRTLNAAENIRCERAFMPDPCQAPIPAGICSLESAAPLSTFHVIAFSLTFENDYLNILKILSLADIPLRRADRHDRHPLIMAGGIAAFLNPEPIADFFDLFFIGEAEDNIAEFLDTLKTEIHTRRWKKPGLDCFAGIPGLYIPSGYEVSYSASGTIETFRARRRYPEKVACCFTRDLTPHTGASAVITPQTEFSDMGLIEVSRGCPRNCRFCAAGHVYQPYRIRDKEKIKMEISTLLKKTDRIGLLGSAVSDHPDLAEIIDFITRNNGRASLSSLRADRITDQNVCLLKQSGHQTFTLAPEAGSQRLRDIIRKDLTREDILNAVKILARNGIRNIKLYFLIGLPFENSSDIDAVIELTRKIHHTYLTTAKNEKALKLLTLSVNPFIPKPFTPFQWSAYAPVRELKQKIRKIVNSFKKERKIRVTMDLPKWGYIQTLLSRGDRRVGRILLEAFRHNGNWTRALQETDINPDFYVYRQKEPDEILPWDFIAGGKDKQALWTEYCRAQNRDTD